jgi:hypothetical protein
LPQQSLPHAGEWLCSCHICPILMGLVLE